MNDDDLLEQDLHYKAPYNDTRFFKTSPSGYNFVQGLTLPLLVAGFVVGALTTTSLLGRGYEAVAVVVGVVLALVVGFTVPSALWRAIGPGPRAMLRPLGCLGPLPVAFALLVGFSMLVNFGSVLRITGEYGKRLKVQMAPLQVQGEHWKVLGKGESPNFKPDLHSLESAREACKALGPKWHVAHEQDLDWLTKNLASPPGWARPIRFLLETSKPEKSLQPQLIFSPDKGWSKTHLALPIRAMTEPPSQPEKLPVLCLETD